MRARPSFQFVSKRGMYYRNLSKSLAVGKLLFYPGEEKKTKYNSQAFLKSKTHNTDGEMESMRK